MTSEEIKEKYKENLIGIWDSIRSTHKGEKTCRGVSCNNCPFDGEDLCNMCQSIEMVEEWAKEHPIVTNADKFREVFGFDMTICWDNEFPCNECQFCDRNGTCNSKEKFWNAEYKGQPKE